MSDVAAISASPGTPTVPPTVPAATSSSSNPLSMSFDDFIDLVNPLQHIPIASSIYRAVTGETINPLSRIAGDALYGGVFGLASAGVSALGAVGDEIFKATTGESASGMVVAALFGDDKDAPVQLAAADPPPAVADASGPAPAAAAAPPTIAPSFQVASLQSQARQSPVVDLPDLSSGAAPAPAMLATATDPHASSLTYGEVKDTAMVQNALQAQALALSLSSSHDTLQAQHALRNNRLAAGGPSPLTPMTRQAAALPLPGDTPMLSGAPANPAASPVTPVAATAGPPSPSAPSPNLATNEIAAHEAAVTAAAGGLNGNLSRGAASAGGDLRTIKSLDSYRRAAMSLPVAGSSVSLAN